MKLNGVKRRPLNLCKYTHLNIYCNVTFSLWKSLLYVRIKIGIYSNDVGVVEFLNPLVL